MDITPDMVLSDRAALEPTARSELSGATGSPSPTRPKRGRKRDPAFAATLILRPTLSRLRKLQRLSRPHLNLKFLSEACHQLALEEIGVERVVQRARSLAKADSRRSLPKPSTDSL